MLNRSLDILNKTYPEAKLITFAYFETLDAPRTIRPHSNLWINVVSSSRSQNMAGVITSYSIHYTKLYDMLNFSWRRLACLDRRFLRARRRAEGS